MSILSVRSLRFAAGLSFSRCILLLVLLSAAGTIRGQTQFTRVYGPVDADVATPAAAGALGKHDPAALSEVTNHRQTVQASPWTGLQATGQITYPGAANGSDEVDAATLNILGPQELRLDVTTPKGPTSLRVAGIYGVVQNATGNKISLPAATAELGLMVLSRLRTESFPDNQSALVDHGSITVDGKALHRVTLIFPPQVPAVTSSRQRSRPIRRKTSRSTSLF